MSEDRWTLSMELRGPHGERYVMAIGIDAFEARKMVQISPPLPAEIGGTLSQALYTMSKREFRKARFIQEATRLGTALAERMEDAEGWHDSSRIEPAKRQLRGEQQ